jgi:predicted nucleotide-binding protein
MARRSTPPIPERPVLTAEQLRRRIERLQNCIQEIEALDLEKVQKRDGDPQVIRVEAAIESALSAAFGHNTPAYMQYWDATQLDKGPRSMRIEPMWGGGSAGHYDAQDTHDARRYLAEGKPRSIGLLQEAIRALEYEIADCEPAKAAATSQSVASQRDLSKVFIVHGHDEAARETVARFIEKLGFEAVILHERPNKGRTIITKFREEAAGIGFAVVLMTPDDVGGVPGPAADHLRPRARQNVVFELGFFIGALGPEHVAALVKGNIERPSDFDGVVYISLDDGSWRADLARELQAAGYEIDWNKAMRS